MQVSGGATNGRARAQRLNPLRIIETKLLHIKTTASTGLNNVQTTIFSPEEHKYLALTKFLFRSTDSMKLSFRS